MATKIFEWTTTEQAHTCNADLADTDFGLPGVKKYVYAVRVLYKLSDAVNKNTFLSYATDGSGSFITTGIEAGTIALAASPDVGEINFSSGSYPLVNSIQLRFNFGGSATGTVYKCWIEYRPIYQRSD